MALGAKKVALGPGSPGPGPAPVQVRATFFAPSATWLWHGAATRPWDIRERPLDIRERPLDSRERPLGSRERPFDIRKRWGGVGWRALVNVIKETFLQRSFLFLLIIPF